MSAMDFPSCAICCKMQIKRPSHRQVGPSQKCLLCGKLFCEVHKARVGPDGICEINHVKSYNRRKLKHTAGIYPDLATREKELLASRKETAEKKEFGENDDHLKETVADQKFVASGQADETVTDQEPVVDYHGDQIVQPALKRRKFSLESTKEDVVDDEAEEIVQSVLKRSKVSQDGTKNAAYDQANEIGMPSQEHIKTTSQEGTNDAAAEVVLNVPTLASSGENKSKKTSGSPDSNNNVVAGV